ncbi:FprA family A-type flavoprotein [Histomonas meleagridis]|nr:FprA family A-type flavoprotein [Histomonas meleagridis]KAH0797072.1 FprA family A-type flavoprotein [Histomonas meleagridis]
MLRTVFTRKSSKIDAGITEVAKDIFWIGVNDWDLREFHSMEAPIGTSYNSYLIKSTKPTIIDAVKHTLANQWIARLQTMYGENLKGIENIIIQHAEPDHTSGLPCLASRFPHIKILATKQNFDTLSRFYNTKKWNYHEIKLGETIDLGNKKVVLAGVPMAHWPESAVTYMPEEKILFSSDAFGQHICSTKRFYDEIDPCLYASQLKSYYANILLRLKRPVLKALKTAGSLPGINMVLPAHGVGLRRPQDIVNGIKLYTDWANQKPSAKVSVLYDCNWFGTERMAVAIASGAGKVPGVDVKMFHARRTHITNVATELVDSACLAVGSACLHESILPDLAMHLNYLKCLAIRDKSGAIFGTYGWSKDVVQKEIRNQLFLPTKTKEIAEPVMALWNPDDTDMFKCEELGKKLGEEALRKASK